MPNPIEFRLESSDDRQAPYIWRIYTAGGIRKLAYSETYVSRAGAVNAVATVQASHVTYQVFRGHDQQWYFRIKALNGEILARSARRYDTESAARSDERLIKDNAAEAPFYDYTKVA